MSQEETDCFSNEVMEILKLRLKKLITVFIYLSESLRDSHRNLIYKRENLRIKNTESLEGKTKDEIERILLDEITEDRSFQRIVFCTYLKKMGIENIKPYRTGLDKGIKSSFKTELGEIAYMLRDTVQRVWFVDNYSRRSTGKDIGKNAWDVTESESAEHYCRERNAGGADHARNIIYLEPVGWFELLEIYGPYMRVEVCDDK